MGRDGGWAKKKKKKKKGGGLEKKGKENQTQDLILALNRTSWGCGNICWQGTAFCHGTDKQLQASLSEDYP